ncbi:unnamed protein product, partial [Ilex paraguariensis]
GIVGPHGPHQTYGSGYPPPTGTSSHKSNMEGLSSGDWEQRRTKVRHDAHRQRINETKVQTMKW